jgi:tetratricopeptide (TPR) repeat protein
MSRTRGLVLSTVLCWGCVCLGCRSVPPAVPEATLIVAPPLAETIDAVAVVTQPPPPAFFTLPRPDSPHGSRVSPGPPLPVPSPPAPGAAPAGASAAGSAAVAGPAPAAPTSAPAVTLAPAAAQPREVAPAVRTAAQAGGAAASSEGFVPWPPPPAAASTAWAPAVPAPPAARGAAAASREAAPPATPAAGSTPSGARTSTSTSTARPAVPAVLAVEEDRRELVARRGDQLSVDLEGRGWLFLGISGSSVVAGAAEGGGGRTAQKEGIRLAGSSTSGGKSSFTFQALEYGDYTLTFQLQDNKEGRLRNEVVHLQVLPEQQFSDTLSGLAAAAGSPAENALPPEQPAASPAPAAIAPEVLQAGERLYNLGEYELALQEFLSAYQQGNPYLADRIAACYAATGEYLAAVKYYRQNLGAQGEFANRAVLGLTEAAVALGDAPLLLEAWPSLLALEDVPIGRELLAVARVEGQSGRYQLALTALYEYLQRYPAGERLDEAYFRLAQIHELESPYRDLRKARDYYRKVYEEFPESAYAAEASQRRLYLDRHFFLVQ